MAGLQPSLVIVTGAGFRCAEGITPETDVFNDERIKPNIGAWIAYELVRYQYRVFIISKTFDKLQAIKNSIVSSNHNAIIEFAAVDILDQTSVKKLVKQFDAEQCISLVHSAGLSAGTYNLPNDNPYLPIEKTPLELPMLEFETPVKSLLLLTQELLPKFRSQGGGKIVVVTSMSGVRPVPLGYSHTSAKAGLHHAVRTLALELNKDRIRVSEIMPGAVNTGLYDTVEVQQAIAQMGKYFGYEYEVGAIPQMPPKAVAEAVILCLKSEAHILSINLVADGQWPNLGA
ncbi:hypothetical protein DCC62_13815 [candidate division KSB1 bacterium]|nr:MAG: hypothetical protein DCC62_13815 [candidate division KSB1 bacterium]